MGRKSFRIVFAAASLSLFLPGGLAAQRVFAPPPPQLQGEPSVTAVPLSQSKTPQPDPLMAGHDLEVGTFYYNRGNYVGALARFEAAIFNDPASAEAFCRAGDTEIKLKQLLPARADWQHCLQTAGEGKWARAAQKQLKKHPAAAPEPPPPTAHRQRATGNRP